MSLDDATDPQIEALATLLKTAVNYKLNQTLNEDPVVKVYGAPLPIAMVPRVVLPALMIYRLDERDRTDLSEWDYETLVTFRFDYYCAATPIDRMQTRWALLRAVWETINATARIGCHSQVAGGTNVMSAVNISWRPESGAARVRYLFVPGADNVYPGFQAQITMVSCYDPAEALIGASGFAALDDFETLHVDWDLQPDIQVVPELEVEEDITLEILP